VLKTTGSAFERFIRDEYTTLAEVNDRIFSTSINLAYTFVPVQVCAPTDEKKLELVIKGEAVATLERAGDVQERVRKITLDVFAVDESASVQVSSMITR
jgi:urate oxidase